MSIVYDYLKQIKDKKEPAPVAVLQGQQPKPRSKAWIKLLLAIIACLLVGLAVYFFAPRAVKPVVKLYRASTVGVSEDVSNHLPMMRSAEPTYLLEGIIYNPSQPFAIINGKMLEPKGRIGDYEVTRITPDSVTLRNTQDNTSRTIHL